MEANKLVGSVLQQRGAALLLFITHHARACGGGDMLEFSLLEARPRFIDPSIPTLCVRCLECDAALSIPLNHDDPMFANTEMTAPSVNADDLPF